MKTVDDQIRERPTGGYADPRVGYTQSEVGQMFGLSRASVYKIEREALRKLRDRLGADPVIRGWLGGEA